MPAKQALFSLAGQPVEGRLTQKYWGPMPRRRELKVVAHSLLCAFLGRNNDVAGYWALGKLCGHALSHGSRHVEVDLLGERMTPAGEEFNYMLAR